MKWIYSALLVIFLVGCSTAPIAETVSEDLSDDAGEWVTYGENNEFSGYLVESTPDAPGVVLIHEWWGLNENIKDEAERLASSGYRVLAVDLYDGRVAEDSDAAQEYSSEVRSEMKKALDHMQAATTYLKSEGSEKVASMGWCFGGGMSMQLSLVEALDATVIYYGNLETTTSVLQAVQWPVLGVFGENDTVVPVSDVEQFEESLDILGTEHEVYVYENVGHAFANPSNPDHDAQKAEDAWMKTIAFLDTHLKDSQ